MSATLTPTHYSTDVVLSLLVGDRTIGLSQVAPDFIVLAEPVELPPCHAEVYVNVDGHVHCRSVFLVDGIQQSDLRVRIETHPAE